MIHPRTIANNSTCALAHPSVRKCDRESVRFARRPLRIEPVEAGRRREGLGSFRNVWKGPTTRLSRGPMRVHGRTNVDDPPRRFLRKTNRLQTASARADSFLERFLPIRNQRWASNRCDPFPTSRSPIPSSIASYNRQLQHRFPSSNPLHQDIGMVLPIPPDPRWVSSFDRRRRPREKVRPPPGDPRPSRSISHPREDEKRLRRSMWHLHGRKRKPRNNPGRKPKISCVGTWHMQEGDLWR